MIRTNSQSFLCKITHIEALIRLIKDDFLRDRVTPDLNTLNSVKSELEGLINLRAYKNQ